MTSMAHTKEKPDGINPQGTTYYIEFTEQKRLSEGREKGIPWKRPGHC
jgi:hypothetical protein